ncbi:MAG: hypothetical protein Q8K55_07490 [Gemmatimonadaceae bacterium]|nr:hypothetical protein [Gemmatimonadaceae bacterium]
MFLYISRMSNQQNYSPSSQGWSVAAFIIILAIVANTVAYRVHKATYLQPDAPSAAAAEH